MLIECPHCARSYQLARQCLGRKMRCAGCREVWHVEAPASGHSEISFGFDPEIHAGPEINAVASSERSAPPGYDEIYGTPREITRAAKAPWRLPRAPLGILAGLALLAASMGAVAARQSLVRHIPSVAPVFAAIGLPVNLRGLELRHVTSGLAGEGAQRVLAIEGEITNISRTQATVPVLMLSVHGGDGQAIYKWTSPAPKATLAFGETMQFRARLAAPPANARDVRVQFAPDTETIREARK